MTSPSAPPVATIAIDEHELADRRTQLLADLDTGLRQNPPMIPPKWFYDEAGSELFEQITRLPEYYPTEAERRLLRQSAADIVAASGADTLVELGSGVSDKTTVLLDALTAARDSVCYVPFDISRDAIDVAIGRLTERYPDLGIHAVVGDLDLHIEELPRAGRRLVALLGGTIGNYDSVGRVALLRRLASTMNPGDHLLLGADLVKPIPRLIAAYDDSQGVTAEFNRNMLRVVNDIAGLDIDVDAFEHRAVWNAEDSWIEMHLVATRGVSIEVPELGIDRRLAKGDYLHTEVSSKFTHQRLAGELSYAGFSLAGYWTDGDFILSLATPRVSD